MTSYQGHSDAVPKLNVGASPIISMSVLVVRYLRPGRLPQAAKSLPLAECHQVFQDLFHVLPLWASPWWQWRTWRTQYVSIENDPWCLHPLATSLWESLLHPSEQHDLDHNFKHLHPRSPAPDQTAGCSRLWELTQIQLLVSWMTQRESWL